MKYTNITNAKFIERPNRFIAVVEVDGCRERVHVKNTGRLKELLVPGNEVWLTAPGTPDRKTKYDLVAVRKENGTLFNIDSQAANKVVKEWLDKQGFDIVIPEYAYGSSRIDFFMERGKRQDFRESKTFNFERKESETGTTGQSELWDPGKYLMEVKGCTLEENGIGYFPDAPTKRGVKHIHELIKARGDGYHASISFVIQMDGVKEVRPNVKTHPEFGTALKEAKEAGVKIYFLPCHVEPDGFFILEMLE